MNLLVSLLLINHCLTKAQLAANSDTLICAGQPVQLNASGGSSYTWAPANTLSNANIANPVATPTATTSYIVSSPIPSGNIVVNGDFAQDNTGFTSQYTYETPTNIAGSGSYFIGANAQSWNSNMSGLCTDRNTDLDNNMMIVNGAITSGVNVWCQTHPVYPNATYNLSAYFQELHNQNYPQLQWTVNGNNVGNVTTAVFFVCVWTHATATWNSGINTSATFCLVDPNIQGNGNDFALDEISITATGTMFDTVNVAVINSPTINLGNDTALCNGQTVQLDAGNTGAIFLWSDNSNSQTLQVTQPGNYSVTVTNSGNCTASDHIAISALQLSLSTSAINTTCGLSNGEASVTVNNGSAPFSYLWSTSSTNDTISGLAGGTYSVTVNDASGCSATASETINTSGGGNVFIWGTNTEICASDSAEICAPSGYNSYTWNTGASTVCIHPSAPGNYYVTVTDNANCSSTSNHVAVSVFPVPPVSISVNGDTLTAFNATSYQWYLNGSEINGAVSGTYIATQTGNYTVQVTDTNGCTSLSNQLYVVTGIENLPAVNCSVYPNPFGNEVGIYGLATAAVVEMYDATGKRVFSATISNTQHLLNTALLPGGVYILKIVSDHRSYCKKLIKL